MMNVLEKILEEIEHESKLAHEEMKRCASKNPLQFDEVKGYARGVEYAVDIIRSHIDHSGDNAEMDGWIPAEERLPEDDRYILLSLENFSLPLVGRYEENEKGGAFYLGDCDEEDTCISNDLYVNAWTYLPERYKGDDRA